MYVCMCAYVCMLGNNSLNSADVPLSNKQMYVMCLEK